MLKKGRKITSAWLSEMFSSPPARKVKGRTRWTHRHGTWMNHLNRFVFVESRNEQVALLALDYLKNTGFIRRYKEQPFTTDVSEFGFEYTPDFFFETTDGKLFAVEVKSHRFITAQVENKLSTAKNLLLQTGVNLLLWADKAPLSTHIRHNLINMQRFSLETYSPEERVDLLNLVNSREQITIHEILENNIDLALIYASIYSGDIHADFRQALHPNTKITKNPTFYAHNYFFGSCATKDSWWNSLEVA